MHSYTPLHNICSSQGIVKAAAWIPIPVPRDPAANLLSAENEDKRLIGVLKELQRGGDGYFVRM